MTETAPDWDPLRWYPDIVVRRWRSWLAARPGRRRLLWAFVLLLAFVVFPAVIGAIASAQTGSGVSQIDGLSWMNIRDSNGVPLSSYQFVTDQGNIFNPANTVLWAILGLEFVGYMAIVTTAIWVVTYAFSFQWLDMFARALTGTADALARQIATPIVLITAATLGAFFVAWFVARGFHAKATMQVVTMLAVAILGPIMLTDPLEDVLSSDGLLTRGRDVGISVAAGLNGNGNPNPHQLVTVMQHDLADNFARKPVQVWNFGHVVDRSGACEAAWSSGVLSGEADNVKKAVKNCGDSAAHAKASNPSVGQVGTGLVLLICGTLLLLFAVVLGIKVIKAALDTVYHGFMAIFGFAAGGFVYGPTQTFLVRNVVDGFIAAARMTVYTIFLGVYVLFMGNLFNQSRDQVMAVIVIACVVEIVAILQIRRLGNSLSKGNGWVANRFALAIQGGQGGRGGSALGMGGGGGGGGGGGMSSIAALGALNTFNASPLVGWLAMRTSSPLSPLAFGRKRSDLANIRTAQARIDTYHWGDLGRANWQRKALQRAGNLGMHDPLGVANALDGLGDSKVPDGFLAPTLLRTGAEHDVVIQAQRAVAVQKASMSQNPFGFAPLQKAIAAARAVNNHIDGVPYEAQRAFAAQAVIAADNFFRHTNAPIPGMAIDHAFIGRVRRNWDSDTALRAAITGNEWNNVGRNTRWAIATEAATAHRNAAHAYYANPTQANRTELTRWATRIANLDHLDPASGLDPWDP
ncbi:hypothetical protein [Nocardia brevicatena]|uniref:hypothetical protein n=1 Tax=Nocardia brevicatena TaxID=37327 RepID=UPI0002FD6253|nr:hypothetical protein [Nocardia brevicatena]